MKIGVIAGTPVDTRMGAEYVQRFGHSVACRASSPSPDIQARMQRLYPQELTEQVAVLCSELAEEGVDGIYVNCNSMTAAIDLPYVRSHVKIKNIVTPFDVYTECAGRYNRLGILAANGQSLAAIEKAIAQENPECMTFGAGLMSLVNAIERQENPADIIHTQGIEELLNGFLKIGLDALILGCTHFPYIADEIAGIFPLPIIDPNYRMLTMLVERAGKNMSAC